MKTIGKKILPALAGLLFSCFLAGEIGVTYADPPPWAPAHGYRAKKAKVYKYIYYPSSQVYYAPARGYYYRNGGVWSFSAAPPVSINLGRAVNIELGSSTPYVYHPQVIREYPVVIVDD